MTKRWRVARATVRERPAKFSHDETIKVMVARGRSRAAIQVQTGLSKSGVRKALIRLGLKAVYGGNGPRPAR